VSRQAKPFRVFLSYDISGRELSIVWRLQTLASVSGLHIDVPSRAQRNDRALIHRLISDSDIVISFLTLQPSILTKKEWEIAHQLGRRTIAITNKSGQPAHRPSRIAWLILNKRQPWVTEKQVADLLIREKSNKQMKSSVGAIVGVLLIYSTK
jgi:hypothetical protein